MTPHQKRKQMFQRYLESPAGLDKYQMVRQLFDVLAPVRRELKEIEEYSDIRLEKIEDINDQELCAFIRRALRLLEGLCP